MTRFSHWRRKRRLRKAGVTVGFTDPSDPLRDWDPNRPWYRDTHWYRRAARRIKP